MLANWTFGEEGRERNHLVTTVSAHRCWCAPNIVACPCARVDVRCSVRQ